MAAILLPNGKQDYQTATGEPLVGGKLRTFDSGTNNPRPTFADAAANSPNANPVVLDGRGEAVIFWRGAYKVELLDANDVVIWTVDGIQGVDVNDAIDEFREELINTTDPTKGDAMVGVKQPFPGAVARTQHDKNAERVSLLDFIPANLHPAILDYTSTVDCTAYIVAAITACKGRRLVVPSGRYNHTEVSIPSTAAPVYICGDVSDYLGNIGVGAIFRYTGTGIGFTIGTDDGNPDSGGSFMRGVEIEHVCFSTYTGSSNLRLNNVSPGRIQYCVFDGASGKVIDVSGGTVHVKLIRNIIRGSGSAASGNFGVYLGDNHFGNFVVEIADNHIYQLNWAIRASEGRSLFIDRNTFENLKLGGLLKFESAGGISHFRFTNNYSENQQGWVFDASTYTGLIRFFVLQNNEFWGSTDAANPNPGFGNIPKQQVTTHLIGGNLILDAAWNGTTGTPQPSVFPSTNVFLPGSTAVKSQVTNKEYEEDLRYALAQTELLKDAGTFCSQTGATVTTATGGTLFLTGPSTTPFGWVNEAAQAWQCTMDSIPGTWMFFCPGGADTNRCSRVVSITPAVATSRLFAAAFTVKGRVKLLVDGVQVFDNGASPTSYTTYVTKFSVAASAASFQLRFAAAVSTGFWIAECRLWEIGVGDFTESGAMNGGLAKACRSLMQRGAY